MKASDRKLHEFRTYQKTDRLEGILEGKIALEESDILELFQTFKEGADEYQERVTIQNFLLWLKEGAEVGW